MPRIEHGAAGCEARTLSIVLCGPPLRTTYCHPMVCVRFKFDGMDSSQRCLGPARKARKTFFSFEDSREEATSSLEAQPEVSGGQQWRQKIGEERAKSELKAMTQRANWLFLHKERSKLKGSNKNLRSSVDSKLFLSSLSFELVGSMGTTSESQDDTSCTNTMLEIQSIA